MIRRKGAKKKEKKEGKEDERIRDGERESKDDAWPRRWGPVGDEHIGGGGVGGGLCEWSEKVDGSVEKKIAGRLFSCRNFYWRVRHAGPMGGGRRRWQGIGGRPGQRIRSGVQ